MNRFFAFFLVFSFVCRDLAFAHEKGAPFAGSIIDPLETHHAHIEDEQRLNFFFKKNAPSALDDAPARDTFMTQLELAVGSYSFIAGTSGSALPRPAQRFVPSVSLEWIGDSSLGGKDKGETSSALLPGVHLWSVNTGWQLHAGVKLPTTRTRENDWTAMFQIGSHFDWTGRHQDD